MLQNKNKISTILGQVARAFRKNILAKKCYLARLHDNQSTLETAGNTKVPTYMGFALHILSALFYLEIRKKLNIVRLLCMCRIPGTWHAHTHDNPNLAHFSC